MEKTSHIPPLIKTLLDTLAHPEDPSLVRLKQTHISYLVFTPNHVYKIKKPVNFGFLDFTTLEKRRHFCDEEVRLNRRLAPDVYIGVVGIARKDGTHLIIDDTKEKTEEIVEYIVKMRRLTEDSMLNTRIATGDVNDKLMKRLAFKIAAFHAGAEVNTKISSYGEPGVISQRVENNLTQSRPFIGKSVSAGRFSIIEKYLQSFIESGRPLFFKRIEEGRIRDCHGDMHSDHISIQDKDTGDIEIIDCIEFNDTFRYIDTVSDAAFLSMDMDFLSRGDLSRVFEEEYFLVSKDAVGRRLMNFYKCHYALVRAKVDSLKSAEVEVDEAEREEAALSAARHFHLAERYAKLKKAPLLIVICGLSGTGKSTMAREFSLKTGIKVFTSDIIRKELAGTAKGKQKKEEFESGLYSPEMTKRTYNELFLRASHLLKKGRPVILDATFLKDLHIEEARKTALDAGGELIIVKCVVSDVTARKRLAGRMSEPSISDADLAIYLKQKEALGEISGPHITFETEEAPELTATRLIRKIFS